MDPTLAAIQQSVQGPAPDPTLSAIQQSIGTAPRTQAEPAPTGTLPYSAKFRQGLMDLPAGVAQLEEHLPGVTPGLNYVRAGIRAAGEGVAKGLGALDLNQAAKAVSDVATSFNPVTNFDSVINQREQEYQEARQAAGQTGIDWWRLGGNVANPVNYLGGFGGAETALGRIGTAAAQGGAISAAQPTLNASPGDFWWDKVKATTAGALTGGLTAGLIESVMPALRIGVQAARRTFGKTAANGAAADAIVNEALQANKVDPSTIDLNVLAGMKQEVRNSLASGASPDEISPVAIVNRAKAESLPVPVQLMKGQATGDPMLFAKEQTLKGVEGVGEPITQRLQGQNQVFIQNLDLLGAKDAPDTVSMSHSIGEKLQNTWDAMQAQKDAMYDMVRNSTGQPAAMDQFTATDNIRAQMDNDTMGLHDWDLLPTPVQKTIQDLENGNMKLNVSNWQNIDKSWGMQARSLAATNGSAAHAINQARAILADAPIADDAGVQSQQLYNQAKQLHAQQMGLINDKLPNGRPNPNYQPLMDAVVNGKAPDTLFNTGFMNAAPTVASKNLQFLHSLDPSAPEAIGRTFMGEIKRQALNDASEARGTVSQPILTHWARDPVKKARMQSILTPEQNQIFQNLADVVETAKRPPVGATINYSGTAPTMFNLLGSVAKSSAATQIAKRLPVVRQVVEPFSQGMEQAATQRAVHEAMNPGVTLKSMFGGGAGEAFRNRMITRAAVPALVAAQKPTKKPKQ